MQPSNFIIGIFSTSNTVRLATTTITVLVVLALFTSYQHNQYLSSLEEVLLETEKESQKMLINSELMEIARSRTTITSQIIDTEEIFEQDELNMKLDAHANQFSSLRQQLRQLPLSGVEQEILKTQDNIVSTILPAQRSAVELAMYPPSPDDKQAQEILYNSVLPGQEKLINSFKNLITIEQGRIAELTKQSRQTLLEMKQRSFILMITVLSISLVFSTIVILRIYRIQRDLRNSHQKLEMTNITLEQTVVDRTKELSKLVRKLKDASEHDELTNIYNRRKFNIFLDEEYLRTNRNDSFFSLMMIDIDCFKQYNDNYGHLKGDQCLSRVAICMSKCLPRKTDFIARYGGEEFVVVLPSTNLEGAKMVAENIRRAVVDCNIQHDYSTASSQITISLGLSTYNASDNIDIKDIIDIADKYLYQAKKNGRNRVESVS